MRIGCYRSGFTGLNTKYSITINNVYTNYINFSPNENTNNHRCAVRPDNDQRAGQTITALITVFLLHFYLTLLNLIISIHTKGIVYEHACSHMLYSNTIPYQSHNYYRCLLNWATLTILFLITNFRFSSIRCCIF